MWPWALFFIRKWREGGAQLCRAKGADSANKMFGLAIPREAWGPPSSAPLDVLNYTNQIALENSQTFGLGSNRLMPVLGGDFKGDVGATKDKNWSHVLRPYGHHRPKEVRSCSLSVNKKSSLLLIRFTLKRKKGYMVSQQMGDGPCACPLFALRATGALPFVNQTLLEIPYLQKHPYKYLYIQYRCICTYKSILQNYFKILQTITL